MSNWDPKANDIFLQAIEITGPEERGRFLDAACAADPALRARVEALIRSHERAGEFLGRPILEPVGGPGPGGDATRTGPSTAGDVSLDFLAPSDKPGSLGRLGHYEVQAVIGRGGMGVVLKAFDENLHRVVAIKVMAPQLATAATARARFTREARAQAAIAHEHVVTIHAVEEANGLPYIVMQYVAGASLQDRLDRAGPLRLNEVLRIGVQAAAGLAAAHKQGLVHRDIKPANILLENGVERVKITDFGLARAADDASLTGSGQVAGTPMYMSPEQAEGKPIDARSDLFSLGSVLYAMCAGRPPFRAASTMAVLKRVCEDTPTPVREVNPEVPDWLADAIGKLHAKNPAERFQGADEVADLLGRHLAHVQHPSVVPLPAAEKRVAPPRPARRHRRWAAAAAALVLLVAGLGTTEATGVTKVRATVIRIFTPDGTLVVETDDPAVKVTVEGDGDLVITGAGPQEVRLRPGSYKLHAVRDGKPVKLDHDLVTITRGDTQVVRVRLEGQAPPLVNSIGMKLIPIPPGTFLMGSAQKLPARVPAFPQHEVVITQPFYMGVYHVTVGQFRAFVEATGYKQPPAIRTDPKAVWTNPGHEQSDSHPVVCISRPDALAFCDWLSAKEDKVYSLPTEAQWEYACRAGTQTPYYFGDDDKDLGRFAWFGANAGGRTHPVGQKEPNPWGLYDMAGNAFQWCLDGTRSYTSSRVTDPVGPQGDGDNGGMLRGGCWIYGASECRSTFRANCLPVHRNNLIGFRVVISR